LVLERASTPLAFQSVSGRLAHFVLLFPILMSSDSNSASITVTFGATRGFTHSIIFAALVAAAAVAIAFRRGLPSISRFSLLMYFFLATASHGLLDAMTDGGLGVAFFAPFDNRRYFLPWTPIRVSPIGIERFFTTRGLAVIQTELLWIWLPAWLLGLAAWIIRRRHFTESDG
jgi:inner membrane protein